VAKNVLNCRQSTAEKNLWWIYDCNHSNANHQIQVSGVKVKCCFCLQ